MFLHILFFSQVNMQMLFNGSRDCGVFMIKYAEHLMHNYSTLDARQGKMNFFHQKLAFELYYHDINKEDKELLSDLERE